MIVWTLNILASTVLRLLVYCAREKLPHPLLLLVTPLHRFAKIAAKINAS